MRLIAVLAGGALGNQAPVGPAGATDPSDQAIIDDLKALYKDVRIASNITALNTYTIPVEYPTNPGNLIKDIASNLFRVQSRNAFSYRNQDLGLTLQVEPWLEYDVTSRGAGQAANRTEQVIDAFVNRYTVKLSGAIPQTTVAAVRDVIEWAPGFFASPSNPFRAHLSTENPLFVERGSDFVWASHAPNFNLSFTYFFNYRAGASSEDETTSNPFRASQLANATYTANDFTVSVVGGYQDERGKFVGSYGQWTYNEATLLYYDSVVFWGSDGYYPVPNSTLPTAGFYNQTKTSRSRAFPQLLIGGAYTTASGYTFNVEYFFYGPGYNNDELKNSKRINAASSGALSTAPALSFNALGNQASNTLEFTGKHFANIQMIKRWNSLEWVVQNANSLQDGSGRLFSSLSYAWRYNEVAGSFVAFYGPPGSALRQDVSFLGTIGFRRRF